MGKKIMIVDDDFDILMSVKNIFEYEGHEVLAFDSGKKCYENLLNNEIPDLIIMDIMMPGMTGWMLSDRIKENPAWRNIPIVFLTGRTDDLAKKASSTVSAEYIQKPFNIEYLKERIESILMANT